MKVRHVLVLVTVAITAGTAGAAGTATARPFAVTSTLDGKSVLPLRIHWIARPQVVPAKVKEVDFSIDGRLGWVEHKPPYVYASDGNWLVTSFLSPGMHTFAVRVVATDGTKSIDTVHARVAAAPAPTAALAGSWQRTVTAEDLTKNTSGHPGPLGLWRIAIRPEGWVVTDPQRGGLTFDVAYLTATRLQMRPTIEKPPFPNRSNGGFCHDTDPLWTWAVVISSDGKTMTLDPTGQDRCGDRAAILQGTWDRTG